MKKKEEYMEEADLNQASKTATHISWEKKKEELKAKILDGLSLEEIADHFNTTSNSVQLAIHRYRLFNPEKLRASLAYRVIKQVFRRPEYFCPNRGFYKAIGVTQKRWWNLFRGEEKITQEEFNRLGIHLKLTLEETLELKVNEPKTEYQTNFLDKIEEQ